jgi:FemAB-related protein (PEP-CTERM system-associated)
MSVHESSAIPLPAIAPDSSLQRLSIHLLETDDEKEWDQFVLKHPDGSPFHQMGWKRAVQRTYRFRPLYFFAKRGSRITGIAPAFLTSNWLTGRCLLSTPFAVYGGVIAEDIESESLLVARLEELAMEHKVQYLELRNRKQRELSGYLPNQRYATFTLPLVSDSDALYGALPKDIRYMIRKGEKAGLRVRHGLDQLDSFYRLMTINLRRLGTPAFPRAWFENLLQELHGQTSLSVVYDGEVAVAAGMSLSFREWMQPYYIGSLDEAKKVGANNFLWWELMKLAAENGHRHFDFGRSKTGSGNFDFKKKWKPNIEPLNYQVRLFERKDAPNFSPANPKFQMATNIWKSIPLSLTRIVGPRVIRWFP